MNRNETPMDEHTLTVVLQEMADELKQAKIFMEDQGKTLSQRDNLLAEREKLLLSLIKFFEEKYKTIQVVAPKPDIKEVEQMLAQGLDRLYAGFEKGPKPINRNWKFVLFPDTHPERYYRILFGRLIPCLISLIAIWFLFSAGEDALISYRVHEYNEKGNTAIKAWHNIYINGGNLRKKEMDNAWAKAEKEE
jgi:hypothetical protein